MRLASSIASLGGEDALRLIRKTAIVAVGATALIVAASAAAFITSVKPYAVPLTGDYQIKPLLSVGDRVPETSDPSKQYQMIGIPDGIGVHKNSDKKTSTVYLNHELVQAALSEPVVGDPLSRGAFVSKLTLAKDGSILNGERAFDFVALDDGPLLPAATASNATPAFARFCSGSLAGPAEGFDDWIYFANEETGVRTGTGTATVPPVWDTFDGKGGLSVAIIDNVAYGLTDLGHFPWENTLAQKNSTSGPTVLMGMEDGPTSFNRSDQNSQLYMYVGKKFRNSPNVLRRNGLLDGKLYVLAPIDATKSSEEAFESGSLAVKWVEIPGADAMNEFELDAASDAAGAFMFARPEDGAFNKNKKSQYIFVTTGGGSKNQLGRIYQLNLTGTDVTKDATLHVVVNADQVIAAGGDTAISPDNIDVSESYLMVNEDGTTQSRAVMATKSRDGSIWRFKIDATGVNATSAKRVAELDPPGRDGVAVGPGIWETSGIVDTTQLFGGDSWIFDVQAHGPTAAPAPNTVEDGQLLLMTKAKRN
jgi:Bacterial protein of unknown function (DUF839)